MKDWLEEASVLVGCFINCAFISVIIALVGFVSLKVIILLWQLIFRRNSDE